MLISFMFRGKRRTRLFLKPPQGALELTAADSWECCCGQANKFNSSPESYCSSCGVRLRVERSDGTNRDYKLVRVGYAEPDGSGDNSGKTETQKS